MTTIRRLCCNDILEMTHIQMTLIALNNNFKTLSDQLEDVLEYPGYSLVAATPGNRINGYGASHIRVTDTVKYCKITDIKYLTRDMGEMIIKAIEERADKIHKVFFMGIRLPPNYQDFFENKLGFTVRYRGLLIKEFPQNRAAAAAELQIFRGLGRLMATMSIGV